jgi:hypothetical protein
MRKGVVIFVDMLLCFVIFFRKVVDHMYVVAMIPSIFSFLFTVYCTVNTKGA